MTDSLVKKHFRCPPLATGSLSGVRLSKMLPITLIASASAWGFAFARPIPAAERVTLSYGFVDATVSVKALRDYAERGEVDEDLAPYLKFLSEDERSQLRTTLQTRENIDPVEVSQFLYSSIGYNILRSLGDIVRTPSRLNGAKGLRGALVLAAAEPQGLSVLGVLEKFPTDTVRINSKRAFQAVNEFNDLFTSTRTALAAIKQQAASDNTSKTGEPLPELAQSGPYGVAKQSLTVIDSARGRTLPVDLYLPQPGSGAASQSATLPPAPLVVASPGLAGDRKGFAVIANHLASHGFAVAALDHPGSDSANFEALLAGRTNEIADPRGFAERPRDISYLLDELTRLNAPNGPLANRLDMKKIGVIGHSYGGTTALSVAGAQLNLDALKASCASSQLILNAADPSLLLQCTALEAPEQFSENLRDERIQSVMAMNPLTSGVFGQAGFSKLAVPSLIVSGSADPIAPALLEQIRPFIGLSEAQPATGKVDGSKHYLALIQGGSHLYEKPELNNADVSFADSLVSPDVDLTNSYLKALSLGFMLSTIGGNSNYREAFTSSDIVQLGRQPLPLYVISALTEKMLMPAGEATPPSEPPADSPTDLLPAESSP